MRHLPLLAALAVLLTGCETPGPDPVPPPATTSTTKPPTTAEVELLPKRLSGPPPRLLSYEEMERKVPEVPETAPLRVRAERLLRFETLRMASVDGRVTARCTANVSECSSAYRGLTIPWAVASGTDIAPRPPFPGTMEYTFRPLKAVVTAEGAYRELWPTDPQSQVRCDELPKVFLAKMGTPLDGAATGHRCQILQVPDENNVRQWRTFTLYVDESGSTFWR